MSGSVTCCRCCSGFIFSAGLTALFIWLFGYAAEPSCTIKYFYVPILDKTLNATANTTINMELELKNRNIEKGIYYDPIDVTFFEKSTLLGSLRIPAFYQGYGKSTRRKNSVETHNVKWDALRAEMKNNTGFMIRVDLETDVRYKVMGIKGERKKLVVGADVPVDDQGMKDDKNDIKLEESRAMMVTWSKVGGVLFNILVIVLLQ